MKIQKCDKCKKEVRRKQIKRINGNWFCEKCYEERKIKRRKNLTRNILKISKEQESEESKLIEKDNKRKYNGRYKEYHREYHKKHNQKIKINKIKKTTIPKIKGAKIKKVSRQFHNYLTKEEKNILYKKYISQGLNKEEIHQKLNNIKIHLKEFVKKLKMKKESDESINIKFKEEFAKLIEQD